MILDILFIILLVFAVIRGFQRGLIVGIFSFVAIIVGLAAAIKLSAVAAEYLGENTNVSKQWLPVLSFLIVFIVVVLLIRLGANLLQKSVEAVMMGWANRLGGIIFYIAIYTIVYSILLFYATQLKLLSAETAEKSVVYGVIAPWGPALIDAIGAVLPFFKDMFKELENFFESGAQHLQQSA
jgi:membrane protein required for colicin V production